MGQLGRLYMPDMYDSAQQGQAEGRAELQRKTLAQYAQPALAGDQGALSKIYSVDPSAGMATQQQAGKFSDDARARLGQFTRDVTALAEKDPESAKQYYATHIGQVQQATGMNLGPQLDPAMLPHIKQIADTIAPQDKKNLIDAAPGHTYVDPSTMKPVYTAPAADPKIPQAAQEAQWFRQHPEDLPVYQKLHPRPSGGGGGGLGRAPSGYRYKSDGSLEAIPGGPADASGSGQGLSGNAIDNAAWSYIATGKLPAVGRGKEGVAQRTAVMNRSAAIAKDAGIDPSELQTVPGRNKALQASLTNLQKLSDVMEKSEAGFQNNTKVAMNLSDKVDRTGSPVVNKWLLGGRKAMGDPDVEALDAAITTMAVDYARIMSGATGAGGTPISTAEEAKSLIKKELSHKSFKAVIDVLNKDIAGQQQAVHAQRGKILRGMQQIHDDAAPSMGGQPQAPSNEADPLGIL